MIDGQNRSFSQRLPYLALLALGGYISLISLDVLIDTAPTKLDFYTVKSEYDPADFDTMRPELLEFLTQEYITENPQLSQRSNDALLRQKPKCTACLNRAVFFDVWENNAISPKSLDRLRRSYKQSPYGEMELLKWRIELSIRYWDSLPADLKSRARTQYDALNRVRPGREWLTRKGVRFES